MDAPLDGVDGVSKRGRYELLAPIAAGGMASVWAARLRGASGFSKIVAIKSMLPDLADEPEYRTMFLDEARIASKLRHPNVCETFDLGEEDGELFMAMEWIDGVSCHRLLRHGAPVHAIAPELGARIIIGACAGLHAAHEAVDDDGSPLAIVHRDVSPHNLLISVDGHVKVTDFGVAKARGKMHATSAGQAKGKLAYMAPEQLRHAVQAVDRRADVFSLGCVLYEITTGEKPFDGETDLLLMRAILESSPKRPSTIIDGYPGELERIIARAMAKNPSDRFQSAEGLRIALERWLGGYTTARATDREIALLVRERCSVEIEARRAAIHASLVSGSSGSSSPSAHEQQIPPKPERDRGRLLTIGMGLLVLAIAFGSLLVRRPIQAAESDIPSPPTSIAPVVVAPPPPVVAPDPPLVVVTAAPRVMLHLDTPGAMIVVDGDVVMSSAPDGDGFPIDRPKAGEMRVVLVKAPGHIDRLFVIDATTPPTVEVSLTAVTGQNESASSVL